MSKPISVSENGCFAECYSIEELDSMEDEEVAYYADVITGYENGEETSAEIGFSKDGFQILSGAYVDASSELDETQYMMVERLAEKIFKTLNFNV